MNHFWAAWTPNGRVPKHVHSVYTVVTAVTLLGIWALRPAFLPGPIEVLQAYPNLLDMGLIQQLYTSLSTNLQAIGLSCLLALPLAYLTVLPAIRPLAKITAETRFVGLTGLVVLFTILFGGGHALKLALLVFGMSVFLITSLYDVVESIPKEEFDHARTLRMNSWESVLEVVILGHLDVVLDTVRQNAAMGWVMLTMVEGLVRFEGGLGAMMLAEDKHIRMDAVFAIQLLVLVIGIIQDWLLGVVKRLLCPYSSLTLERQ